MTEPKLKFKRTRILTLPLIKTAIDIPVYIQPTGKMFVGKELKVKNGEKKKEPATLLNCINLESGEESQIICNAVLKGIFEDEYPNHAYVGKNFEIVKLAKQSGRDYNPFTVIEIELE